MYPNKSELIDGYDLPYMGGGSHISVCLEYFSGILMLGSFMVAIGTNVLLFKLNKKKFLKWRRIERFIVYEAINDVLYYLIQVCYVIHVTVIQEHFPNPKLCTVYAFCSNVFGMSQTCFTAATSILAFMLIFRNKELSLGPKDGILLIVTFGIPVTIFTIVAAFGQFGPNGLYCNYDGITGSLSHLIITSIIGTMTILVTSLLYILICIKIYQQSKILEVSLGRKALAETRALAMTKNFSLLILAFLVQFGVFILDGIWFAYEVPPPEVHHFVVFVSSCGGIVNGIVSYIIRKRERVISPTKSSFEKSKKQNKTETVSVSRI